MQVVFAGFSAESVAQRVIDCRPKVVITCNAVMRGPKLINLKDIVDAALVESSQNGISVGVFNSTFPLLSCMFWLYFFLMEKARKTRYAKCIF